MAENVTSDVQQNEEIDPRMPRAGETREQTSRPAMKFVPASSMPDPEPQDGWRFKWVRRSVRNEQDVLHYQRALREGWEPVNPKEQPRLAKVVATANSRANSGEIFIAGSVLCKMPEELARSRGEVYDQAADNQMAGVTHTLLQENDPSSNMRIVPDYQRQVARGGRRVMFGRGKPA